VTALEVSPAVGGLLPPAGVPQKADDIKGLGEQDPRYLGAKLRSPSLEGLGYAALPIQGIVKVEGSAYLYFRVSQKTTKDAKCLCVLPNEGLEEP
jgi:hypothetical protein